LQKLIKKQHLAIDFSFSSVLYCLERFTNNTKSGDERMWVGKDAEKKWEEERRATIDVKKVLEEIINHFGEELYSTWLREVYYEKPTTLILFGTKVLFKHAKCENCSQYVGVPPNKRILHNISILNSYCMKHLVPVKIGDRCAYFDPVPFVKTLMRSDMDQQVRTGVEEKYRQIKYSDYFKMVESKLKVEDLDVEGEEF